MFTDRTKWSERTTCSVLPTSAATQSTLRHHSAGIWSDGQLLPNPKPAPPGRTAWLAPQGPVPPAAPRRPGGRRGRWGGPPAGPARGGSRRRPPRPGPAARHWRTRRGRTATRWRCTAPRRRPRPRGCGPAAPPGGRAARRGDGKASAEEGTRAGARPGGLGVFRGLVSSLAQISECYSSGNATRKTRKRLALFPDTRCISTRTSTERFSNIRWGCFTTHRNILRRGG